MQNKTNQILITIILLGLLIIGAAVFIKLPKMPDISDFVPPAATVTPSYKNIEGEATKMAGAGNPIPTKEFVYLYNQNFTGLQDYLDGQAQNWLNMSMNIHSGNVYGVTPAQGSPYPDGPLSTAPVGAAIWKDLHSSACDLPFPDKNPLCVWLKVGFTSVYKGVLTGGVNSDFILHPTVSLKQDIDGKTLWYEIKREPTKDNKVEVTYGGIAVITYTGNICITSVEQSTFSLVHQSSDAPTDKSYTLRVEESHNWITAQIGDLTIIGGNDIDEDYLRNTAEGQAKAIALLPEKVTTLYTFIKDDMSPEGKFRKAIEAFYTDDLAKLYGVKGFEIVFKTTDGDPLLRCDGTPINK